MSSDELTDAQVAEFKEAFNLFDRDGDGRIRTDELGVVMRSLEMYPTEAQIKDMVASLEQEGGQVDVNEFLTLMAKQMRAGTHPTEESLREAFRVFAGPEASHFMAADELKNILMNYGEKLSEAEIKEMMEEANIKPDGEVDFHEFIATILKG